MKKLEKDVEARELLASVRIHPFLNEETHYDMEQFVLTKTYRCTSGSTCSEARAQKWRKRKKKNTVNLPPTQTHYTITYKEIITSYTVSKTSISKNTHPPSEMDGTLKTANAVQWDTVVDLCQNVTMTQIMMLKALVMTLKIVILTKIQNMTALQIAAQLTLIPVILCA